MDLYYRATKSRYLSIFMVFLRVAVVLAAVANTWCLLNDQHKYLDKYGLSQTPGNSAFDVILLSNIVLIAGMVLNWFVLTAIWLFTYAFVILTSSLQYIVSGTLPWLPGISYTASLMFIRDFELDIQYQSITALLLALAYFLIVFCAFIGIAVREIKVVESDVVPLPSYVRNPPVSSRPLVPNGASNDGRSTTDGLPTYSEIELPPKYDESMADPTPSNRQQPPV